MIKIELHNGDPIICKGLSSDPLHKYFFIAQMESGKIQEIYWSNIKHVGITKLP